MNVIRQRINWVLFFSFFLLECAVFSIWLDSGKQFMAPLMIVIVGIGQGVTALCILYEGIENIALTQKLRQVIWLISGLLGLTFINYFVHALVEFPINPVQSDIIPSLKLYVQRLFSNVDVYAPMQYSEWEVIPNYFPFMWLPYIIPEYFGMDYRWMALLTFLAAIYVYVRKFGNGSGAPIAVSMVSIALLMTVYWQPSIYGHAVELTPVAFYMLLCLGLVSPMTTAITLSLCLLSRYSFGFWGLLLLLVMKTLSGWTGVAKFSIGVTVIVLCVFVIPFLTLDAEILGQSLDYYQQVISEQWKVQKWQAPSEVPHHLNRGIGFAYWFYFFLDGDIEFKIKSLQRAQIIFSLLVVLTLIFAYWKSAFLKRYPKVFLIAALKVYLVVFYAFIQVPFHYLFLLPLMISVPLFLETHRNLNKQPTYTRQ